MIENLEDIWRSEPAELSHFFQEGKAPKSRNEARIGAAKSLEGKLDKADSQMVENPLFARVGFLPTDEDLSDPEPKHNKGLAQHFARLSALTLLDYLSHPEEESKAFIAFRNAAESLSETKRVVKSPEEMKGVLGFGPSCLAEIGEYLEKGTSARLERLSAEHLEAEKTIKLFRGIEGVSEETALALYKNGARSLEQVGREPLTHAQAIGLRYYYHLQRPLSEDDIDPLEKFLAKSLSAKDFALFGGRAPNEASLLLHNQDFYSVIEKLYQEDFLLETLSIGPDRLKGIAHLPPRGIAHKIDVRNISKKEWPFTLLAYKSPPEALRELKREAKEKGYLFTEKGLKQIPGVESRQIPPLLSERAIIDFLGTRMKGKAKPVEAEMAYDGKIPTLVCIRVAELRPEYDSLLEWMKEPSHLYIGRTEYHVGVSQSKWNNPYPVKKYGLEECLSLYEKHIRETPELYEALDELSGKVLGCWCPVKEPGENCHGKVLIRLFREKFSL